jgi:hypothetical protein
MIITCWPAGKMLTIDRAATRVTSDAAALRDARAHDVTFGQSPAASATTDMVQLSTGELG